MSNSYEMFISFTRFSGRYIHVRVQAFTIAYIAYFVFYYREQSCGMLFNSLIDLQTEDKMIQRIS